MKLISHEPATGDLIWEGESGDAAEEVAKARASWAEWAARSFTYRAETLRRFVNVVRSKEQDFADLIAREAGKPFWEAKTEVGAVIGKVDISTNAWSDRTGNKKLEAAMGNKVSVRHKPHGVLAVLGPYNFPAHLPNGHIVPALLAGNAVVFKPSEKTPASGQFLVDCYHEAGVPEGVIRCLQGGPEVGKALASDPGIDGLLFTGSAHVGKILHQHFADTPQKILAIEAGGNNPLVAWDMKDIHAAAAIIVQSAYLSAGQRCTCARRLIVSEEGHERILDEVLRLIDRIIVDHPHADPQPFMGPLIDNASADKVQDQYMNLMMKGGTPIRRLDRPYEERPYLTPALIDVTNVRDRPDEEIFGPVLQLIRVRDFDEAIREANNTRFGLAASVLTREPKNYNKFWANVRAGVINWNKPTNGAPSTAPFGGVGISGNHRPSAYYAADYCAYPVTSVEAELCRANIGQGLRDPNMIED
ncbi:succinylglutamate-semialdehyde dehydrogenase [Sphingomicrobium marinum]|uniref:succinylglutamate-semialdehyde dehydrogenase n=1 Tax=Sphingomicrobium marinum TaxID=1227950 RepID=UPI002240863F|nr:succinylglutamate-semialdehyde dehydrogenase [Sphingomicrobium marinum]